jgi:hypothetical protein
MMTMTDEERELDLQLGEARSENRTLRRQRDIAMEEALRLHHTLEHIYATAFVATKAFLATKQAEKEHDDKDSY